MKKIFLLISLLLSINAVAQVPSYVPTTGLKGWWSFTGNANDESGNGNNGTVQTGTTLSSDRFSNLNSSYYVDGIDCVVPRGVLLPASINNAGEYSVSIWFYTTDSTKQNQTIFNSFPHNYVAASFNYLAPNTTAVFLGNGAWDSNLASSYPTINLMKWHHLVIVKTVIDFKYYQDGNLVNTINIQPSFNSGNFTNINAGAITINGSFDCYESFNGRVDDVGLWNRALTQSEITTLYNGCPTCETPTTIVASNITSSKATISWTGNNCAAKYRVRYRVQGTTTWVTKIVTAPITTKNLTLLQPLTTYEYQVRTDCNSAGTSYSAYSTIQTFTTICDCIKPTNIAVSNVTQTGATVSWLGNSCAVKYRLQYRVQGTTTWTTKTITAPTLFYNIIGLTNNTIYEYHLRSDCNSTGTVNSGWSTTATITTPLRLEDSEISSSTFYVSPNPCSTCFVNGPMDEQDLIVTDIVGRKINVQFTKSENGFYINLSENSKGIFLIRNIKTGEVVKFVRE